MDDLGAVHIDPIRTEDTTQYRAARLRALIEDPGAFSATYDSERAKPPAFWMERVTLSAMNGRYTTLLARSYTEIVGMVTGLHPEEGKSAELVSMWVAPEARRRGVGVALVNRVVSWAKDAGAETLELWVMNGNEGARQLYEQCGFGVKHGHLAAESDPCKNQLRMALSLID